MRSLLYGLGAKTGTARSLPLLEESFIQNVNADVILTTYSRGAQPDQRLRTKDRMLWAQTLDTLTTTSVVSKVEHSVLRNTVNGFREMEGFINIKITIYIKFKYTFFNKYKII